MSHITRRLSIILSRFVGPRPAREAARRWSEAQRRAPELAQDVIRLGGVMAPTGAPLDPQRLAYEAGRRDLAHEVLALMTLSIDEINDLASRE